MARRRRNPAPLAGGGRASEAVRQTNLHGPEYTPSPADQQPEPIPPGLDPVAALHHLAALVRPPARAGEGGAMKPSRRRTGRPCPCGCGRLVKPEKIGGHVRRFASPECKARFHFAARKLGEALIGDRVFTVSTVEDYLARGGLTASYTTASVAPKVSGIAQAPYAPSAAEKSPRAGPAVRGERGQ
jgi:hypothetical protein